MTLPLLTAALLRRGAGEAAIGQVYAANTLGAIAGVILAVHARLPLLRLKGTLPAALLRRGAAEAAIGKVYAATTLGAIAGVILAVHAGLPLLGLKGTLIAGSGVDAALGLLLLASFSSRKAFSYVAVGCAAVFVAATLGFE